jgi:hypothetical protein
VARKVLGNARARAGLLLSRQGPCGLPAACAARSRPTPRRRSSANRFRPRFHCFQTMARSRRAVAWPVVARARQAERARRVGVFLTLAVDHPVSKLQMVEFLRVLAERGWIEKRAGGG